MGALDRDKWQEKYGEALNGKLGEPLLGAWVFYRTGGFAGIGLGFLSPLAAMVSFFVGKKRAAGLPQTFLLAVTPTKVHAFSFRARGFNVKVKDEVAVWDRSALKVDSEDAALNTTVTLTAPGEDEKVVCSTGKDEQSRRMIRLLQDPSATAL